MKTGWTKKELVEALKDFNDEDKVLINIHDDAFYEDNYEFYLDLIHMGIDHKKKDRGNQIWLCPIQNSTIKKRGVNVAYGEKVCNAINEEDYEEVAKTLKNNDGDIIKFNPFEDSIEELLEHLEGNFNFQVVSDKELDIINNLL